MEKAAYTEYVKSATASSISALVAKGVEFEKAAGMVKEAFASSDKIQSKAESFTLLEKTAAYVMELESKVEALEKSAKVNDIVEINKEPLEKLSNLGFTPEELESLREVDSSLLEKMASVSSTPWTMGKAAGVAREKTDPLLEFLLGGDE